MTTTETKNNVLLTLSHISASYDGKRVLNDVSMAVAKNDFWGIVGPNGGGKTTLVRLMLGLKQPDEGMVTYYNNDGQPTRHIAIGYLPQYTHIDRQFPISVREVVLSGLSNQKRLLQPYTHQHHTMVNETLQRLDLTTLANRHIAALSGGQLQRVLLARAIVAKPDILVLDEPNTYMDRHFQRDMYAVLHELNNHCAIVIVSHDVDAVRAHTKQVAFVNRGLTLTIPEEAQALKEMPQEAQALKE